MTELKPSPKQVFETAVEFYKKQGYSEEEIYERLIIGTRAINSDCLACMVTERNVNCGSCALQLCLPNCRSAFFTKLAEGINVFETKRDKVKNEIIKRKKKIMEEYGMIVCIDDSILDYIVDGIMEIVEE
ncbi:hypothetical protein LJC10_00600 [Selenomonadales bacterium OttesenSCG-928-I06]|nr:hypothetical protein [Selenomonadales bacterium OttesenSCG-928-I06]